jgi:hypothetical protein
LNDSKQQPSADTLVKATLGAVAEKRGKAWGKSHGYVGRPGGWIYNAQGRKITQGWWSFYNRFWQTIEAARIASESSSDKGGAK